MTRIPDDAELIAYLDEAHWRRETSHEHVVTLVIAVRALRAFRDRVVEIATGDDYDVSGGWTAIAELMTEYDL